jgi:hypothetical protein
MTLSGPTTIKARTYQQYYDPSPVASFAYVTQVSAPTMTPAGGEFDVMPMVTIAATTPGATIRYTTDRNEPTEGSPLYTGPFHAGDDMTVKAVAFKSGWAPSVTATETYLNRAILGEEGSPATVAVVNMTETAPIALQTPMAFTIAGALLSPDPADVVVYRNGSRLPDGSVFPGGTRVDLGVNALQDGRNDLELEALDTNGLLVYDARTVWAGTRTILVTVYDPWGYGIQGATVTASLDADGHVQVTGTTNPWGQVSLAHLPVNEVVTLSASAPSYRPWSFPLAGAATSAWFALDLDNNDFSQGLDGWETSSPRAGVDLHSESSQPLVLCPDCAIRGGVEAAYVSGPSAEQQPTAAERPAGGQTMMLLGGGDWDLVVDTKNLFGPQTVTRQFYAAAGATSASVRYRFHDDAVGVAPRGSRSAPCGGTRSRRRSSSPAAARSRRSRAPKGFRSRRTSSTVPTPIMATLYSVLKMHAGGARPPA